MEWLEVKIKTSSCATEVITGFLMAHNILNVRIIDDEEAERFLLDHSYSWDYREKDLIKGSDATGTAETEKNGEKGEAEIIFYLHEGTSRKTIDELERGLAKLPEDIPEIDFGPLVINCGPVNDDDWLHEWRKTYKPFKIGKSIVVRPYWEEYEKEKDETVFTIDPGAVFGTGLHQTTQLCIMALEDNRLLLNEAKVLDIGCGSGILSIVSLLLGSKNAVACDIDPGAAKCAKANARLNNIEETQFEAYTSNIFEDEIIDGQGEFDIVLANIVADVIIELTSVLKRFLKENGMFIASGIIDERAEEVKAAFVTGGLKIKEERQLDGWNCFVTEIL